ncbi:MAG: hypothetical protein ACRYG4_11555 [Janthinobacterium lividum]
MYHSDATCFGMTPENRVAGVEEPPLMRFDRIRALLVLTRLPPQPEVYDLFWRCLGGDDHALGVALDAAIVEQTLDLAAVATMRSTDFSSTSAANAAMATPPGAA